MINETLKELKKLENGLEKRLLNWKNEGKEIESDLILIREAIRIKNGFVNAGLLKEDIPNDYDKNMFQEKKVIFAIQHLNKSNVREIADFISNKENGDISIEASYRMVQQVVIRLTKENKIIRIGDYASTYKLNIID